MNDRNELFSSSNDSDINNHIANEEEIASFWQYQTNDYKIKQRNDEDYNENDMDNIQSLSHFLIKEINNLIEGNISESINYKRQLLLQRILVMFVYNFVM